MNEQWRRQRNSEIRKVMSSVVAEKLTGVNQKTKHKTKTKWVKTKLLGSQLRTATECESEINAT